MEYSSSTGNPIVYWILYVILVGTLVFCGYGIGYRQTKYYKRFAWLAIILFSLIEGLRWLRGADYYGYYVLFETGQDNSGRTLEPLFQVFSTLFCFFHLPPTIAFVFFSGLFIAAFVLMCSRYKEAAVWCLPIMFVLLGGSAENILRQYAAISFLILAYYFYVGNEYKKMLFSLLCAPLIHLSALFGVFFFFLFIWKRFPYGKPLLLVGLYCFLFFFWNPEWLSSFADILHNLDVNFGEDNNYNQYLNSADLYFTLDSVLSDGETVSRSFIYKTIIFLSDFCVVYWGYKACKQDSKLHVAYYFAYFGILIIIMAGYINILRRFGYWLNWTVPLVIGLILSKVDFGKNKIIQYIIVTIFLMRYAFYGIIANLGVAPYAGCGFIWDK